MHKADYANDAAMICIYSGAFGNNSWKKYDLSECLRRMMGKWQISECWQSMNSCRKCFIPVILKCFKILSYRALRVNNHSFPLLKIITEVCIKSTPAFVLRSKRALSRSSCHIHIHVSMFLYINSVPIILPTPKKFLTPRLIPVRLRAQPRGYTNDRGTL